METTKKKKFEKQFIYRDEARTEAVIEGYRNSLNPVNQIIPRVEEVLKRKLTDPEKRELADNGYEFVMALLRDQYPFKSASDKFNLEAMGLNIDPLLGDLRRMPEIYCHTVIKKGFFELSDKTIEEVIEANSLYTETDKENETLELARALEAAANLSIEKGFTNEFALIHFERASKLIKMGVVNGKYAIVINPYAIKEPKED